MEKIKTATGREFDCEFLSVITEPPRAYIRIANESLVKVVSVFSDPAETAVMQYADQQITQYTKLVAITPEMDAVRVVLGRG